MSGELVGKVRNLLSSSWTAAPRFGATIDDVADEDVRRARDEYPAHSLFPWKIGNPPFYSM